MQFNNSSFEHIEYTWYSMGASSAQRFSTRCAKRAGLPPGSCTESTSGRQVRMACTWRAARAFTVVVAAVVGVIDAKLVIYIYIYIYICTYLDMHVCCYVMLCYVMLCYAMLCYVMSGRRLGRVVVQEDEAVQPQVQLGGQLPQVLDLF